jgi:hypothetical protein
LIDKKTVFVLGAGASCPYGYPSGARLRERICLPQRGLAREYGGYGIADPSIRDIERFQDAFRKSSIKSIDLFMAHNPKFAEAGKYIIALEIFMAERQSLFREEAKLEKESSSYVQISPQNRLLRPLFLGGDWHFHLYNRLIEGLVGLKALPDFSNGNLSFITFNYDRSLEQLFYEALRHSFTEIQEDEITKTLKQLKILHVYGQITPLKWQDPNNGVDYKPGIDETLLRRAANNIRTIYEEKQNPELAEAQNLLKQADEIFFLGFGYAKENMEVLGLPGVIPENCNVYGTAFGLYKAQVRRIRDRIVAGLKPDSVGFKNANIVIDSMDCLELLENHLE